MGFQNGCYGNSMVFLWDLHGVPVEILYGISMMFLWDFFGITMGFLWHSYESSMMSL